MLATMFPLVMLFVFVAMPPACAEWCARRTLPRVERKGR